MGGCGIHNPDTTCDADMICPGLRRSSCGWQAAVRSDQHAGPAQADFGQMGLVEGIKLVSLDY